LNQRTVPIYDGVQRGFKWTATPSPLYEGTSSLTTPPPGFDWDPFTNSRCEREYGFSFFDLVELFEDKRFTYLDLGEREHKGEMRRVVIGRLPWGLIVAVVFTVREGVRRLIWVRPARRGERRAFNEYNGVDNG
jgi:uncharacterized DUF497 family protein